MNYPKTSQNNLEIFCKDIELKEEGRVNI